MTEQSHDLPLPTGKYVPLKTGLTLHYLDIGEGPIVVWLHGSGPGASGYSNFKGNYPVFEQAGYRNIIVDLPGFGRSDKPADAQYHLDFFITHLHALLDSLGIDRCTLLGNSLGGAIALGTALAHPERVEKLILLAPGGVEERETYFKMKGIQRMVETFAAGPMGIEQMRHVMQLQVFDPSNLTEAILAERAAVAPSQPANLFSTMLVPNMTERLGELNCPIFGFWGSDDVFNPPSGVFKLLEHARNARFTLLNRCGHWVQVEHPELFNRQCLEFLQED
ncbi:alpha/beta fold hydrolase [Pseudomonas sp. MTM4]|uniref:alpha/beta fold hydrolase n=1 Tax=unclassified Pseudomonas TaxID=196821 RepID=UPI0018D21044|nr:MULTISPECIES: alpha/beta hydrolase [unclassified Pseudomonas]MBC8650817.1 alpha/beta fold hydrolase [Pseudomonas sp. MT4]QXY91224.1 alpha/beta fold hydrolase [Pseudomonas sp. MTM4]